MTGRPILSAKPAPVAQADVKRFQGNWLIYRKVGASGYSRTAGGGRMPRFRHPTYDAAETEAKRLAALFPDSTFVLLQEGARVRMKTRDAEQPEPSPGLACPEGAPPPSPGPSPTGAL